MLKKSIMILAVLAFATPVFAADKPADMKVHIGEWPCEFKWEILCDKIKVYMHVGYYVKIKNCADETITLSQDKISEYSGCTTIQFQSNFEFEFKVTIEATGEVPGTYKVNIDGDSVVPANMGVGWEDRKICVKVTKAKIYAADPNKKLHVATVTVWVRPTASPGCCPEIEP